MDKHQLQSRRVALGMTQAELAAALGCSRRWLRELASRGVITIVTAGGGRGNETVYRIGDHLIPQKEAAK